jgi:hypothetical protein
VVVTLQFLTSAVPCVLWCAVLLQDTYPIAFSLAGKASDFYRVPHMPLQALARPGGEKSAHLTHAGNAMSHSMFTVSFIKGGEERSGQHRKL